MFTVYQQCNTLEAFFVFWRTWEPYARTDGRRIDWTRKDDKLFPVYVTVWLRR